jgi:hypothetical protein
MNNIIQISDLKCPSKELECVLKDLFNKYDCIDVQPIISLASNFNPATGELQVTINGETTTVTIPVNSAFNTDLSVVASATTMTPAVASQFAVSYQVANTTTLDSNVQMIVNSPAGFTYVGHTTTGSLGTFTSSSGVWAVGALAAGANATITITYTANSATPGTFSSSVSGVLADNNPVNNVASVTVSPV